MNGGTILYCASKRCWHVCVFSSCMDASCRGGHPGEKCSVGQSRRSTGHCRLYWPRGGTAPWFKGTQVQVQKVVNGWGRPQSHLGCSGQCGLAHIEHEDLLPFLPSIIQWHPFWCLHAESFYGLAPCFICSCGSQPPSSGQLGSRELAIARQTDKKHVANADDHAYCW